MDIDGRTLDEALTTLGEVLASRGLAYEVVAIGGSGLPLLGLMARPTRDLDPLALVKDGDYVSADPFPPALKDAVVSTGRALGLADDWLNPGPTELLRFGLPDGFESRVSRREYGGLTLQVAGRLGSKHAADLRRLEPTESELLGAARWTRTQDPSDGYREVLIATLAAFGVEADDAGL